MNLRDNMGNTKKIIVYGAGRVAERFIAELLYTGLKEKIEAIAVTDKSDDLSSFFGIPVIDLCKLKDEYLDSIVIIAVGKRLQNDIKESLLKYGFDDIYTMDEVEKEDSCLYQRYVEPYLNAVIPVYKEKTSTRKAYEQEIERKIMSLKNNDELHIARVVTVLGTKCSLRCTECNNLMPYFTKPQDLEKSVVLKSLRRITELAHSICKCELIGGEPFLANNLADILSFLIEQENVYQIEITTNGTILPKEDIVSMLKNPKVMVRISDYGDLVDKKKIITFLEDNAINYVVLQLGKWISPGTVNKRGRNREELEKLYKRCSSGYDCKTLFGDKIFACARAASLYELGYMKEEEYLTVDETLGKEQFKEFLLKEYSEACDYCDITCDERRLIAPAEQLRK